MGHLWLQHNICKFLCVRRYSSLMPVLQPNVLCAAFLYMRRHTQVLLNYGVATQYLSFWFSPYAEVHARFVTNNINHGTQQFIIFVLQMTSCPPSCMWVTILCSISDWSIQPTDWISSMWHCVCIFQSLTCFAHGCWLLGQHH